MKTEARAKAIPQLCWGTPNPPFLDSGFLSGVTTQMRIGLLCPRQQTIVGHGRFGPNFVRLTPRSRRSRDPGWTSAFDPQRSFIWDASSGRCYDIRAVQEHLDHSGADTTKVCFRVLNRGLSG